MSYDYVVVGAGFTGATFARQKAEQGHTVLVLENRDHVGGNAYDYRDVSGILVHKYGPHLFHTNSDKVWSWLSRFTGWVKYEHRVLALLENGEKVPVPFNFRSMEVCFEHDVARAMQNALRGMSVRENQRFTLREIKKFGENISVLSRLHDFVYENIFKHYTQKMWNKTLEELGPTVADRVPVVAGYDDRYFADTYQALPVAGYTTLFHRILMHSNIVVKTSDDWMYHGSHLQAESKVLYTGPIDGYFAYSEGKLPYRGIEFTKCEGTELRSMKGAATLNYVSDNTHLTRATSMRVLNGMQPNSQDVVVCEQPNDSAEFYPYTDKESRTLYEKYQEKAIPIADRVRFAGRLGSYQYLNMDQAVAQALKIAEEF